MMLIWIKPTIAAPVDEDQCPAAARQVVWNRLVEGEQTMNTPLKLSGPNSIPPSSGLPGGIVLGMPGDLHSAWLCDLVRMQCEMLRLAVEQFGQGMRILERFAACWSPSEITRLQFEIGSAAAADQLDEARQMLAMLDPAAAASALPVS